MSGAVAELVRRYIDVWNERDEARRRSLIKAAFDERIMYCDPNDTATGPDALEKLIRELQVKFPDFIFELTGQVNTHHNQALFEWSFGVPGAPQPAATGTDVMVSDRGRITHLFGFIGRVSQ